MNRDARIMVATDDAGDADLLTKMLCEEFTEVAISIDPGQAVADFERCKPSVLLLAFKTLEKAERHYLGLYRLGTTAHSLPHRTIVFCDKTTVNQAYELCRKGLFDDYILFWPLSFDTRRLSMAVNNALRDLETQTGLPAMAKVAAQARRIAELEDVLAQSLAEGGARAAAVNQSIEQAELEIGIAMDDFSNGLVADGLNDAVEVKDASRLRGEIETLKTGGVQQRLRVVKESMVPVHEWMDDLKRDVAPHLESARALKAQACKVRPVVLVVDDDEFQHTLLTQILGTKRYELVLADSGARGLAAVQKRRPDLILMDIDMPDMDGLEVLRRLKGIKEFADIPVIMITGHGEKDVVIKSHKAGADDFVVKPFEKAIVLQKVNKFVHGA